MKIYLLLLAIFATCQGNQVSRSAQLEPNSELASDDLNREAYLDGQDNIERARDNDRFNYDYVRRAGLGQAVYVGRTRGLDDDSYRYPMSIARSTSEYDRNLPTETSENDVLRARRPYEENRNEDPALRRYDYSIDRNIITAKQNQVDKNPLIWNRAASELVRSDLGGRPNGLQGTDVAKNAAISRPGNYNQGAYNNRNYEINPGSRIGSTNYLDRSAPIGGAGAYDQENYGNRVDINSEGYNPLREALISRHDYTYPDPEIEYSLRVSHVPVFPGGNGDTAYNLNGYNNNDHIVHPDMFYSNNDAITITKSGYNDNILTNAKENHFAPDVSFGDSNDDLPDPTDNYGGMDYNSLDPNYLETYTNNYMTSTSNNKINDKASTADYNDSTRKNIFNNSLNVKDGVTKNNDISDRFGESGFYNTLEEIGMLDDSFSAVESNSHYVPMAYGGGECQCSYNNGQRLCSCDYSHKCDGTNCKRVTQSSSSQAQTTTCEYCKTVEAQQSSFCEHCKPKEIVKDITNNYCENCKAKEVYKESTNNYCENCKAKEVYKESTNNYCENCKAKEMYKESTNNYCENCKAKEMYKESTNNYCDNCKAKEVYKESTNNYCENCKAKEMYKESTNNYCDNCKAKEMYKESTNNYCDNCKAKEVYKESTNNYCENCKAKEMHKESTNNYCDNCKAKEVYKESTNNYCENCKAKEMYKESKNNYCENCKTKEIFKESTTHEHSFNHNQETVNNFESSKIKQSNSCESKHSCNGGCDCKCCCGCCNSCGCGGGCGCNSGGCSSSCKHKKSSSCNDYSYENEEHNHYNGNCNNNYFSVGDVEKSVQSGQWSGGSTEGLSKSITGRGTHADHISSSSSSNSGSTGAWTDYGTFEDGSGYFGSVASGSSSIKGGSNSKGVASNVISSASSATSNINANVYGTASAHGGGSSYGHIFTSFGSGGLYGHPHGAYGR